MKEIDISLVQDKGVRYEVRQGVKFAIEIQMLDADMQPMDLADLSFFSQIRSGFAKDEAALFLEFSLDPDEEGNFYTVNTDTATLVFTVDETAAARLTVQKPYYFECKTLNVDGEAVDSFQATIVAKPDVARA